jgi:hypothetical protein
MPPIIPEEHADGTTDRIVHFQARENGSTGPLIRVQVNMNNRTVIRRIKPSSASDEYKCAAVPMSSQNPNWERGSPGSAIVTITKTGETDPLWSMEMRRPSALSGGGKGSSSFPKGRGSGIELINVKYKNKKILRRASLPILNINYLVEVGCGPKYRDWANDEWTFGCDKKSEEQAPGFRECQFPPRTILDKVDGGNFHGIGYYQIGEEVVFISQLAAGWYRYISEWRFAAKGTIFPRWSFGGTEGGENFEGNCVCVDHHHHAYWRFDFDIETPGQSLIREFNNPKISLSDAQGYHTISSEVQRDHVTHRHWEIFNADAKHGYALFPEHHDRTKDTYGVGDAWFMKYKGAEEFDDGYMGPYKDPETYAHLDNLVKPSEALTGRDLVVGMLRISSTLKEIMVATNPTFLIPLGRGWCQSLCHSWIRWTRTLSWIRSCNDLGHILLDSVSFNLSFTIFRNSDFNSVIYAFKDRLEDMCGTHAGNCLGTTR